MSHWIRADDGRWHRYRGSDNTDAWDDGITCVCGEYFVTTDHSTVPSEETPDGEVHAVCLSVAAREAHWRSKVEAVAPEALSSLATDLAHEIAPGLGSVVVTLYPSATTGLPWQHAALRAEGLTSDVAGTGESFAAAAGEILAALERSPRPARSSHVTLRDAD